ncbi:MAG: amidohydrolase family protein, partial [Candidatus Lokiarchaeota archaeon]|nr:amidohydrolase family protein [Candidatus Lokiarchaeota archaeon]MBD3340581.1 amidohydrolase family protein [Candidatus Lokiarchaeota archaeon]
EFIESLLKEPNCSIGTDIVGVDLNTISAGAYGAFPKVLGELTREKNLFSLEEAVFRMTGLPSQQMQLPNRGVLKKGAFADITIFDPLTINCTSCYTDPHHLPTGVKYVLINGKIVLEKATYNPVLSAGRVIKRT